LNTLCIILALSTLYFAWRAWRLSEVCDAIVLDDEEELS
jgi:hypothetical protein